MATFDYVLTLISYQTGENEMGDPITTPNRTDVLCDVLSVSRSEHYAAAAHGLPPEIVFVVNQYEYAGQKTVEFEGLEYNVLRTYKPKRSKGIEDFEAIELICGGMVNATAEIGHED